MMSAMKSRGTTPMVATLLLFVIVVSAGAIIFAAVQTNVLGPDTGSQVSRDLESFKTVQVKAFRDGTVQIFVLNRGSIDGIIDKIYVKDANGSIISTVSTNRSVKVNEIQPIFLDSSALTPWNWFEITCVTKRGNSFTAELYGSNGGFIFTNDLISKPGLNELWLRFNVSKITVNGVNYTDPFQLNNLIEIDEKTYNVSTKSAQYLGYGDSIPATYYDFDTDTGWYAGPKNTAGALDQVDNDFVHLIEKTNFISGVFGGKVSNVFYSPLNLTFAFFLNTNRMDTMQGTLQFWDWKANAYVDSGNGYWAFVKTNGKDVGNNYWQFTSIVDNDPIGRLVSKEGEWKVRINVTSAKDNLNNKFNYLALTEAYTYNNGIETIFYYNVSSKVANPMNVSELVFSTTGIFPIDSLTYYFDVYNYHDAVWENVGLISGNSNKQTFVVELVNTTVNCADYISPSKMLRTRILPANDLPLGTTVYIDQAKLMLRMLY